MNNTPGKKEKRNFSALQQPQGRTIWSIIAAIVVFAAITWIYFYPVFEGKRIKQHDMEMHKGMSHELTEYHESTGETALWTDAPFGGMPAWNISVTQKTNLFQYVHKALSIGLPSPLSSVFISMLGFFILLLVLDVGFWGSLVGAIAYGFTSYLFIIIGAGHNSKAFAMAYAPPVIAGILLTYNGKYLWGIVLTAIALAMELFANHLQITYYLLLIIAILIIVEFIFDIRAKRLGHFFKASVMLLVVGIICILTSSLRLYANYEFGKETTRGKPVLTRDEDNQTTGLDRDYITQWSYGKGETWSLLIPNAKGGASAIIGKDNPALKNNDKITGNYKLAIANCYSYWGDQPITSGPVYVGAIVVFLFVLGALTVKGKLKWALLIATVLSILLSWGKNFMGFTNFFLDYVPGYAKFRAVSMTLVIAEITIPMLGFLGLAEIVKSPEDFKKNLKKFYIAFGVTAGICLLFYAAPKLFFSFTGIADKQYNAQILSYFSSQGAPLNQKVFEDGLTDVRVTIFRKDAMRSLIFIILAAVPLFLYGKGKLKGQIALPILGALVLIDMFSIDKRYLNNDNFIDKRKIDKSFTATTADQFILNDKTLSFRVADITKDMFNDASTCYFHKSLGGYCGVKLRRYQDIITQYLGGDLNRLRNVKTAEEMEQTLSQLKVLNMLNTKYIIYNPNSQPYPNDFAYGNAWAVDDIQWVDTPNEEIDAIGTTELTHAAILNKEFKEQIGHYAPTSANAEITLTDYKPNQVTYSFNAAEDKLVVFSEIWTSKGWTMRIDGQERPILRANYLLRAAMIPAGQHEIVMRYEPSIWKVGNAISLISSLAIILFAVGAVVITLKKQKAPTKE